MIEKLLLSILDQLNLNGYIEEQIYMQLVLGRRHIDQDDLATVKFIVDQLSARQKTIKNLTDLVYKGVEPNE